MSLSVFVQGERQRNPSEGDNHRLLDEPKRTPTGRGRGGRGRGRGAGRGSMSATRLPSSAPPGRGGGVSSRGGSLPSTPAGRAKAPVSRPPLAGSVKGSTVGKKRGGAAAVATLSSSVLQSGAPGDNQKLVLTIKRPLQPAAPVTAPVADEPMSESSSGSYSGSSDSDSDSGSSGSGSESDSSSGSSDTASSQPPPPPPSLKSHANGPLNGLVPREDDPDYSGKAGARVGSGRSSAQSAHASSPYYSNHGPVMWSPSKTQQADVTGDPPASQPSFASPNYTEYGSSSPAFASPSYPASLSLSLPGATGDSDLYH